METVDIRRQNLQALVDQSSLSEVARKVGKTPSQLGDILKKRRTFGERMARSMEKYAGWKEGTLDQSSKNDQEETAALENLGFKRIPIYSDIRAGLFNGGQLADRDTCINNGDFVLCDDSYRDSDFALRIAGDSMEPVFKEFQFCSSRY